ncbi:hypothetical protein [Ancylobacter lacus]|uniref:hypothetical protein n=1 Tax=Ancylobacter lacus TaxID=2579970 RepID=UPI001BCC2F10|nr:hypothetical protein [Ancylobacter lacus]MBS7540899.1 hypothetical protein [Ancylobacter lacus]
MTRRVVSKRSALAVVGVLLVTGACAVSPFAHVMTAALVRTADAAAVAGAAVRPDGPAGFRTCFVRQVMDYSGPAPRRTPKTVCDVSR